MARSPRNYSSQTVRRMKIRFQITIALFLIFLFLSCSKKEEPLPLVADENVCAQLTDTTGFNLYHYPYFSKEDWYNLSHEDKVKNRQLPEELLKRMTMEQLFNHCMWWEDLKGDMLLFNTNQQGFRAAYYGRFNGIQELYKREGIHLFLEAKVKDIDAKDLTTNNCWFYNHILEHIYVQPECLVQYSSNETIRCLDVLFAKLERRAYLTTIDSKKWGFYALGRWAFGIGNIMIINEYKPFSDEMEKDVYLKNFMNGRIEAPGNIVSKISTLGTEFYNQFKNETK